MLEIAGFLFCFANMVRYSEHILTFRILYLVEPEITTLKIAPSVPDPLVRVQDASYDYLWNKLRKRDCSTI